MPDVNTSYIDGKTKPLHVLIAAGGTGGHVFPAVAIADELKTMHPNIKIKFIGSKTRMEWQAVPKAGYNIANIWISGFHRRLTLKNLVFPLKLLVSLIQSWRILSSFKPDAIISCGGFVAGPPGWVAQQRNIPLFIQEQNSFPGVTNRLLSKKAQLIFTAFKDADQHFPKEKTLLTGNPVRKALTAADKQKAYEHFNFSPQKPTLLVLGGSGGARSINEAVVANINALHDELGLQIIWQCGSNYYESLQERIDTDKYSQLHLLDFVNHMPEAYEAADMIVCRAGALTCSELAITGNAAILVPSPNVAGDHQAKNAQSLVSNNAALLLSDDRAKKELINLVKKLTDDEEQREAMQKAALKLAKPHAAKEIAEKIYHSLNQRYKNVKAENR